MTSLNIKPIQLLRGSHDNTGTTGQGCFMNVIAYLNGDPWITDASPCVCRYVRGVVIVLNDMADDKDRQKLLPYIERAMGSYTDHLETLQLRRHLTDVYELELAAAAGRAKLKEHAKSVEVAQAAAQFATMVAGPNDHRTRDVMRKLDHARQLEHKAHQQYKADLLAAGIRFLDAALPEASTPTERVTERARDLVALAEKNKVVAHGAL